MRPYRKSTTGVQNTAVLPLDLFRAPFEVSLSTRVDGVVEYTVEYTLDDVWAADYDPDAATSKWTALVGMDAAVANANATIISPVTAVRMRQTAGAGSVFLDVVQAGLPS